MGRKRQDNGDVATMEPPIGSDFPPISEPHVTVTDPPIDLQEPEGPVDPWTMLERMQAAKVAPRPEIPVTTPGVVGWPVQFCEDDGTLIPATLQRRSRTNGNLWDLKLSLNGAMVQSSRSAVAFSGEPKPGCWNFLPGLKPRNV